MIQSLDLIDIWRARNPEVNKYTWVSGKRPLKLARLDFFLATSDIYAKNICCNISHGYRSNHSPIGIELDVHEVVHGRGFWKFNHSLLHDSECVKLVKQTIEDVKEEYGKSLHNKQMTLEMIKLKVRGATIPYSSRKKSWKLKKKYILNKKIEELQAQLQTNPENNSQLREQIEILKEDLMSIRKVNLKGAMIRAKAEAYCNFEKPTRYFCNLEKRNYANKVIHRLKHKDRVITNQQEILDITKHFYSKLLQSKRASNPLRKRTLFIN